ncbi:mitogen-activated protein kinase kinase kinase YODA [Canna indica]|uniref:mitogen-activated protein kinase kinase kinase n=1 Tax=Canna indica TaxID=4628 RepID=A0AAQ3K1Y7_9LILI|nr:mitogen-activated protein kinase kinase kinase YODA [Canna indica]
MPWWKKSPSRLFFSSSSSSSPASPSSPTTGGRSHPSDDIRRCLWSRRKPRPRLARQNNLRRLTELEIIEALCLDDDDDADADADVETVSSSTPVSLSPSNIATGDAVSSPSPVFWSRGNFIAAAGASSSTPVSRTPSNLDATPSRSASSPIQPPRPLPRPRCAATPSLRFTSGKGLGLSSPSSIVGPLPSTLGDLGSTDCDGGSGAAAEPTSLEPVVGSRSSYQTNCRSQERVDILFNKSTISDPRKVFQVPSTVETTSFGLNIPARSVVINEFSNFTASPTVSPRKTNDVDFLDSAVGTPRLQVRSTAEIPSSTMMRAFSSPTSPEKTLHSPRCSPLCSPTTRSPILRPRYASAPPSPLRTNRFSDRSPWHENFGNVNVHPLPLPPHEAPSIQMAFAPRTASETEVSLVRNQWQKRDLIGSGTFGNVYEASNRYNGALCAMKEVNIIPDDSRSAECLKQLEQEINFLSQFKHPNIVQYYGSEMIENRLYIYLEYVHPGSINKYIRKYCGSMTESVVRNFTRHILKGLIYLHSRKVMHRDIKGANLLVNEKGVVKLADFGMAKHLSGATSSNSVKGSAFWMAPEMLQSSISKEGYDLAVDIWSLGCTVIEMFTGKHPWSDLQEQQAMFKVLSYSPPLPENLSDEGKNFLQCCFRRNPAERPTASMLLEHPFIQNCRHYNLHGSNQVFTGIKHNDTTHSPRDGSKSKSGRIGRRKHISNSENWQSHPKTSESARFLTHSNPRVFQCPSPPCSSHTLSCPAGSHINTWNGVQWDAEHLQPYGLPKRYGKEVAYDF